MGIILWQIPTGYYTKLTPKRVYFSAQAVSYWLLYYVDGRRPRWAAVAHRPHHWRGCLERRHSELKTKSNFTGIMNTVATQYRQTLIRLSQKYVKSGSGSMLPLVQKKSATGMEQSLHELLAGISYVLVGGLATQYYMPARFTIDADILVLATAQEQTENRLQEGGYQRQGTLSIGGSTWLSPAGLVVDLLTQESSWAEAALKKTNWIDGVPVIALPYLVLMKLLAGRMQDLADITRMLGAADDTALEAVRTVITRYEPTALEDVESMIMLGKLENQ
jgi:hypothetical protein